MRAYFYIWVFLVSAFITKAQIGVPNTTPVTQNFNGMGTPATTGAATALPANWKMSPAAGGATATWTNGGNFTAVTQNAPSAATCNATLGPTTGGRYCWGESNSASCTDRSIGFLTSGGYSSTNSIMAQYQTTNANFLSGLTISYDLKKFRSGTSTFQLDFYFSTDGTTWISQSSLTLAADANNTTFTFPGTTVSSQTINISSLCLATNANFYLRWNFTTPGSANSKGIGIDNISVTAAFTAIASKPTTPSSAILFSEVGCNGFIASWANGDGAGHLVVASASPIVGTPSDGTAYTANSIFGSGSTIAAGEYVVYSGVGNSILITGLNASTTYYVKVFEYNGINCAQSYLTASILSGNQATNACWLCPGITGIMIDACNATCGGEGDNEIIFLTSGAYTIPVLTNQISVTYNTFTPPTTTYVSSITSNAGTITKMNTLAACGTLFVDALTNEFIPVNAHFIIVRNTFCPNNYNMADFCAITPQPIYVIFSTDANWTTGGNFSNNSCPTNPNPRYFETDFSEGNIACINNYDYNACLLNSSNGAFITFNPTGGTATSYSGNNSSCNIPLVLPTNLVDFKAEKTETSSSRIQFTTTEEKNIKQYTISKSSNGFNYINIETFSANNRLQKSTYFTYDNYETANSGIIYYRLEEEDFNGQKKIIGNCFMELKPSKEISIYTSENEITVLAPGLLKSIELLCPDGKNIAYVEGNENDLNFHINLADVSKGFYLLKITDINEKIIIKKIIH